MAFMCKRGSKLTAALV